MMTEEQAKKFEGYSVSKIFRNTKGWDVVEKIFVDHGANPPRAYPTGEFYELLGKTSEVGGEAVAICAEETVSIVRPEDFEFYTYKRTSDIPENCVIQEEK